MNLYDITGLRVEYVKPDTNLTAWGAAHKPFVLCNASLYDGGIQTNRRPSGPPVGTVIEGKKLVRQEGDYPGIGIKGGKLDFGRPFTDTWDYFLAGYNCPVVDGKYNAPAWRDDYVFGSKNSRIGVAYTADRRMCIVTDDNVTLKGFAQNAIRRGALILVNLDGGGSRHLLYNGRLVYQSPRIPYNALAFYKDAGGGSNGNDGCPYPEPTWNIRWGSIGSGAKWVQWQLTNHNYPCAVDGIFGAKSAAALRAFQRESGLGADGICGAKTREALKR